MTTVESFDLPHGRSVRVEESVGGVSDFVLDAPAQGGVYVRMRLWSSELAQRRGLVKQSLGLELDREAAEALHSLLGELIADPEVFDD